MAAYFGPTAPARKNAVATCKNHKNYLFRLAYKQYFSTKNISNYLSYIKYFKYYYI